MIQIQCIFIQKEPPPNPLSLKWKSAADIWNSSKKFLRSHTFTHLNNSLFQLFDRRRENVETLLFYQAPNKLSRGLRSGLRGGHRTSHHLLINRNRSQNCSLKNCGIFVAKRGSRSFILHTVVKMVRLNLRRCFNWEIAWSFAVIMLAYAIRKKDRRLCNITFSILFFKLNLCSLSASSNCWCNGILKVQTRSGGLMNGRFLNFTFSWDTNRNLSFL